MKRRQFKRFLSQLYFLTFKQKATLSTALKHVQPVDGVLGNLGVVNACKHCQSKRYYRWGYESGMQRYKCRSCGRTYNALTNTPLAKLRKKEQWIKNAQEMLTGASIQKTSEVCDVATSTSFRWRHRFLELMKTAKPSCLKGIVEADETYFRKSHKGERGLKLARKRGGSAIKRGLSSEQVPVLVARDRNGQTLSLQLPSANKATLTDALKPMLSPDSVLCTDGKKPYPSVAARCGVLHKQLNIAAGVNVLEGAYHIQNVNAYDNRLKAWMRRFHGVATKYLQSYLGWRRWIDARKNPAPILFLQRAIYPKNTFPRIMLIYP